MKNRRIVPTLIYLVLLIAVFSWLSGVFTQSQDQIPYSTVLKLFRNVARPAIKPQANSSTNPASTRGSTRS